ncbi:MAG: cation-translocating P-type ATPase [Actinobacteria bacterium]|nr:cation-translocating P-type ATPase [Actinomycetota bacterium]
MKELIKNIKFRWLLAALIIIIPFLVLSYFSIHASLWVELPIFIAIIIIFGRKVFLSAFRSLIKFKLSNINLLMTIAVIGAIYLRQLEEAAIIIVLFALGDNLEEFGIARSQTALKKLIDSTPKTASVKGSEKEIPVEDIEIGEIIIIKPGDIIPMDGTVIFGNSLVDESTITGEPLPRNKYLNDTVYAGTLNGSGYLEVKVTKKAKDNTLSKIIDLTYKSSEKKTTSQKFIEKFAKIYTPVVILAAILLVIIPVLLLNKPFNYWFTQALTLLIISCPCALVISTPVTIFSAIGNATKKGALIKGGIFLEEMGKLKAIAFDKTKTLTKGEPVVSDIIPLNGFTESEVLACAAGLEVFSEHPVAKSIIKKAEEIEVEPHIFKNFQSVTGKGLTGECTVCVDKRHFLGNIKYISEKQEVGNDEFILKKIDELEKQGKTVIVMSDDKRIKGMIAITDEIRKESKPVISSLSNLNITPIILTGDNKASAKFIASNLGIENVKAELLPENKVEELKKIIGQYKYVAMAGDGVNDAPALATASVGIAMGATGSDIAIENSDIALLNDNLNIIPYIIKLGKKAVGIIRFNIIIAITVKFIFLMLAALGLSNLSLAIFSDVGITILVIINGLRLFGYK